MDKATRNNSEAEPAPPPNTYTLQLTPAQANALKEYLAARNYVPRQAPYADFAYATPELSLAYYPRRGRLVVQGKGAHDFVEFVLEPEILQSARLGYEEVHSPEMNMPRLGVDESGKGDFFGPLCAAGVYVNAEIVKALQKAGIRDSKSVGSDREIARLAGIIRRTPGCVYRVVPIGNEAYNRMYVKMKSVNRILAWAHAQVIENLCLVKYQMQPPPALAIVDQFAHTEDTVERALKALGREIEVKQRHKAESDVAVAAASILARDEFVQRLKKMEQRYGMVFPKGASDKVEAVAQEFVQRHGAEELRKVAKLHFRTAYRAQGLPEPPRQEWKGRRS
ncbi:MAG: ribonuclease HIII [Verrucomicrobiae bacterium]|nr:ribonuclease HIII [Verrucomicrobiae bacterium]